jgi:hypothetical protein
MCFTLCLQNIVTINGLIAIPSDAIKISAFSNLNLGIFLQRTDESFNTILT